MKKDIAFVICLSGIIGLTMVFVHTAFIEHSGKFWVGFTMFKYFSFISNLIIVIYFGLIFFLKLDEKSEKFKNMIGFIVMIIAATGLIYFVFIEPNVEYMDLGSYGKLVTHYLVPALVIGYFIAYTKNFTLEYRNLFLWLVYPVAYMGFLIIRGIVTDDYIYSFLHVDEVGVLGLALMTILLLVLMVLLSVLAVYFNKKQKLKWPFNTLL